MNRVGALLGLLSLAAGGWLLSTPGASAQAPEKTLVVEGRIVNGTAGAGAVPGLKVLFHDESATRHEHLEAVTDQSGRFRFKDMVFDAQALYGVSVSYLGALYGTDLDLSEGSPTPITLTVYDATDDDASVGVSSVSLLLADVDGPSQTLSALEIVRLKNGSDTTYVPGPEPMKLLRFGLPPGAQGLRVDTGLKGGDVLQVDRGFALTASVPPGEHEVMYSYRFPYTGSEAAFTRSLLYGADSVRVLAPYEVGELTSANLGEVEEVQIGSRSYQLLTGADRQRRETISVEVRRLPVASFADRLQTRLREVPLEYAALAGLAALMASLLGLGLWRRNAFRRDSGASPVAAQGPEKQ